MMSRFGNTARDRLVDVAIMVVCAGDAFLVFADLDHPPAYVTASAVVAVAALAVRRRVPYLAFIAAFSALALSVAGLASLVALYTVAVERTSRIRLSICAAAVFVCYLEFWEVRQTTATVLLRIIYSLLFAGAPVILGLLVRARTDLSNKMAEIERARRTEQELLVDKALARERADLAREMHDVVSHKVSLIAVQAGAWEVTANSDASVETAHTIRTLSVQTLDELREMVGVLRASGSATAILAPQLGIDDLPALIAASGVDLTLTTDYAEAAEPSEAVQRAIYRTVQEGLTNIAKHAPGAAATLDITMDSRRAHLTLANGAPARKPDPLPSDHNGILGLRERAELLGGSLQTRRLDEGGFRLAVELPLHG